VPAVHVGAGQGLTVTALGPRARCVALLVVLLLLAGCAQLMADSVEALLKRGIESFTAGRYDEAISTLLEVVRRDPASWNAYLYLARSYIAKSSWTDALASSRKALEFAPSSTDVVPVLAEALLGAGTDALRRRQLPEAIGHFTEYVKLRPADAQGYLQLGKAYLQNGNVTGALDSFRQVLQLNPNDAEAMELLRGHR
jgi:Flp pilus assembly protein TadD